MGNPSLTVSENSQERYLSLTGVILEMDYVRDVLHPEMERLKATFFAPHPDDPLILHRVEIRNKNRPFHALRDASLCARFDRAILAMIQNADYAVITVVIDKFEHKQRYSVWQFDPYHYCMTVLVERYVYWLRASNAVGDVMAESRGGKEDRRLKASFERIFERGTDYIPSADIMSRLTSRQLKVKPKAMNIAGLQLADLIAYPCFAAAKARQNHDQLPQNFGGKVAAIIEASKYCRSPRGRVEGWGRKWLP